MKDDLLDDFEVKESSGKPLSAWVITLLAVFPVVFLIATIVSFYEIASILVDGAVLFAISILLLTVGLVKRVLFPVLIGVIGLGIVIFITLLIWIFEISPSEVKQPIPILLCILMGLIAIVYMWMGKNWKNRKK